MAVNYLAIVRKEVLVLHRTCAKSNTEVINSKPNQHKMEILPKYRVGDVLWTIEKCKARSFTVEAIITTTTDAGTDIRYTDDTVYHAVTESECFTSKDELIAQL